MCSHWLRWLCLLPHLVAEAVGKDVVDSETSATKGNGRKGEAQTEQSVRNAAIRQPRSCVGHAARPRLQAGARVQQERRDW